jgi:predicted secreted hydrolase
MSRLPVAAALLVMATAARGEISFPKDHGAHPDAAIEWWYYTGHLKDAGGREYGFELTFFRVRELSLAHFAWTDVAKKSFRFEEKAHLLLPGVAGTAEGRLSVFNESWSAEESGGKHHLHAAGRGWDLSLELKAVKPPILHGEVGISRKGPGTDDYSHYVSETRLTAFGQLRNDSLTSRLSGTAWFDHEWGPGGLPAGVAGWDWFALQLDDGSDLMLYRMRGRDGSATPFSSGTFVDSGGAARHVRWSDVTLEETRSWKSPRSGARYPAGWRLRVAPLSLDVAIRPLVPDQELVTAESTGVTYWEGSCAVEGRHAGRPASGRSYVELTGYAGRDIPGFGSPAGASRESPR